ncbi:MAG: AI-2E family transporter [Nanohaloarchaea archaeon QH_8_44_6]|nr:MAG: AI-2E family transporter [Nanohaloarchaea archaeon QH_8_44_6]
MEFDRQNAFIYSATVLIAFICFLMISPYIGYLLSGLLLAFVTYPLFQKFRQKLGPHISATLVLVVTVFTAILPFLILLGAVGGDAAQLVSNINTTEGLETIETGEQLIAQYTGQNVDLQQRAGKLVGQVASALPSSLSSVIGLAADLSIGISLMLFLQFYALKDGKKLIDWTKKFDYITTERQDMLYTSTARSVWSVVKGHVFMAFTQGILSGIGLWIFGVPNILFWTFMMILLGFIPLIGAALIWAPAALFLMLEGQITSGILLLIYGTVIVGGSDNLLRPLVVDDEADIHPFFILIGLIGGVGLFGPVGLFLGPVIFGILKNLLDIILQKQ